MINLGTHKILYLHFQFILPHQRSDFLGSFLGGVFTFHGDVYTAHVLLQIQNRLRSGYPIDTGMYKGMGGKG